MTNTKQIKKGIFGEPVKIKSHGTFNLEAFKKWSEEKQKLDKELEEETLKGSFSERVRFLVERDRWDDITSEDWIKAILQVADERKL